jgi:hypothetical protein
VDTRSDLKLVHVVPNHTDRPTDRTVGDALRLWRRRAREPTVATPLREHPEAKQHWGRTDGGLTFSGEKIVASGV